MSSRPETAKRGRPYRCKLVDYAAIPMRKRVEVLFLAQVIKDRKVLSRRVDLPLRLIDHILRFKHHITLDWKHNPYRDNRVLTTFQLEQIAAVNEIVAEYRWRMLGLGYGVSDAILSRLAVMVMDRCKAFRFDVSKVWLSKLLANTHSEAMDTRGTASLELCDVIRDVQSILPYRIYKNFYKDAEEASRLRGAPGECVSFARDARDDAELIKESPTIDKPVESYDSDIEIIDIPVELVDITHDEESVLTYDASEVEAVRGEHGARRSGLQSAAGRARITHPRRRAGLPPSSKPLRSRSGVSNVGTTRGCTVGSNESLPQPTVKGVSVSCGSMRQPDYAQDAACSPNDDVLNESEDLDGVAYVSLLLREQSTREDAADERRRPDKAVIGPTAADGDSTEAERRRSTRRTAAMYLRKLADFLFNRNDPAGAESVSQLAQAFTDVD